MSCRAKETDHQIGKIRQDPEEGGPAPSEVGRLSEINSVSVRYKTDLPDFLYFSPSSPSLCHTIILFTVRILCNSQITMTSQVKIQPIPVPEGSGVNFGATVTNVDVEHLTGKRKSHHKQAECDEAVLS